MSDATAWILANPRAGRGGATAAAAQLATMLRRRGIPSRVISTPDAAAAGQAATDAVQSGALAVIACGGDGTVNSVHAPLVGTDTPLGILPAGSGDDIATFLGFTTSADVLAARVGGPTTSVDVGSAIADDGAARTFLGVMSCGFDSAVNERANAMPRMAGQRYRVAMVRELASFRPQAYRVVLDDREQHFEAMLIAVGNGDRYGKGMRICPGSSASDGLLDVTVLTAISRTALLRLFPKVYSGRHVDEPSVQTFRAKDIRIEAMGPIAYADGERIGALPVRAGVRPAALRILAPVT